MRVSWRRGQGTSPVTELLMRYSLSVALILIPVVSFSQATVRVEDGLVKVELPE